MKICSIDDCNLRAIRRGMCNKHYKTYFINKDRNSHNAKRREYYKKNKDKIKEYHKEYFEKNPEKLKRYRSNSYYNNKEKRMESFKKYRDKNPDYSRMSRRRRANIRNNGYEKYTESQVLEIYGTNCYLCNQPIDLEATRQCGKPGWERGLNIEHVIDIALGGPDTLENVRPAHGICNLTKKPHKMI